MKRTTILIFLLSSLFAAFFSCSKSSSPNITPPTQQPDTLYDWRSIGGIASPSGINDIWFTSLSKGFAASGANLYQTQDSGKTWTILSSTFISSSEGVFNLFFTDAQHGFGQSNAHLLITQDGGSTWAIRPLATTQALNVFFSSASTGYYGDISNGLYKTTDTGHTWTKTFQATQSQADYPMYFLNPARGYVLSGDGIFSKTVDSAASWQQVKSNIFTASNSSGAYNTLQFLDSLTGYYASGLGVIKTVDGGATWNTIFPGNGSGVNVIKFVNASTAYYKADHVVYKTTDGGNTWKPNCILHNGDFIIGMFFFDSTTGWICTSKGYVLKLN